MADDTPISVALVRRFQAEAEAIYAAWTEPKLIARWLAPGAGMVTSVENDLRNGGRYRIGGRDSNGREYSITGTYVELLANTTVALTWSYDGPAVALRGKPSIVTARMRRLGPDLTELTVTHEKLSKQRAAQLNRENWNSCLDKLGWAVGETRPAEPQQATSVMPDPSMDHPFYSEGHRAWQDASGTRHLADRLEEVGLRHIITASDAAFIAHQNLFFLSTVDRNGQPSCSYKGGARGFVAVIDESTLVFPNYDGSGMYLSIGNMSDNPKVALLFIDFERQARIRVMGRASVQQNDPELGRYPGADLVTRIHVTAIFDNCPRYIHKMKLIEESVYVPDRDKPAPVAAWKKLADFSDVLTKKDAHLAADDTDEKKAFNRDSFYRD